MNPENFATTLEDAASDLITHGEAGAKLEAGKDHAAQAARELKEAAVLKAQEVKSTAIHKAEDIRRRVESTYQDARSKCETSTRNDPMRSLLYAFGAGFVVGYIFRR